jgi:creatinine amidohydrolase
MQLQLSTWPEVEAYLKRSTAVLMPIGSTEQHGPNGVIGIDALVADAIARAVGERTETMVAPCIAVGMAQHHMAFPGSMTLKPSTLIAVVRDSVVSLARHGFNRFYFVNGHGGNAASVTAAFSEIYAEASMGTASNAAPNSTPIRCRLKNWWLTPAIGQLSRELFGGMEGHHATPSEVAVTQYLYPAAIRDVAMSPALAPSGDEFADAADFRRQFPDGRIASNPGLATPDHGRRLFEAAVTDITRDFERFR